MSSEDEPKDARIEELEWQVLEWEGRARHAEQQLAAAELRNRILRDELDLRDEAIRRLQQELSR